VIAGILIWTFENNTYSEKSKHCIASGNSLYTVSDSINIKTYNGYLTNVVCKETGAVISLKTPEKLSVMPNDTIIAKISKSVNQKNRTYYRSINVNLSGEPSGRIVVVGSNTFTLNRLFYILRHEISKHIGIEAGKAYGLIHALILGDKSGLSYEEKTVLQSAGVYHICAVSGLHVSIVAIFIGYIVSFFGGRKSIIKLLVSVPILLILLGITGFSVSAIRAVFMASVALIGKSFMRKADSLNLLGLVLTLILIISPFSAFSPSLLLTFFATFGILLLGESLRREIITGLFIQTGHIVSKPAGYLIGVLSLSIAATSFTVIISEVFFSNTTILGVFANLIVLQLVTVVYILAIIMILFSFIPFCAPITMLFAQLATLGVKTIMTVSSLFADTALAKTEITLATILVCFLIALAVAVIYYLKNKPSKKKKKKYIAYSAAVFAITFIIALFGGTAVKAIFDPDDGLYHIAYIDVGQGMSSVVSYGNSAVIIDCGGSKDTSYAINNYLHSKSIKNISTIIVSHLHSDHCNALNTLLDEWNVSEVIIPFTEGDPAIYIDLIEAADKAGTEVLEISNDDTRKLGNMYLCVLTKHLNEENIDQNDNCLAVVADIGGKFKAIFPGDLTEISESFLVEKYGSFLDCDILSVPHHGSKFSSSALFLDTVTPSLSVISVGKNSFGHPTKEAMERISKAGSQIMTTLEYGTIEVITDGTTFKVQYGK
jgi:competence protein ComEC